MSTNHRPYRDQEDLTRIGRLLRRAHVRVPGCNAWSFARFDIWAQRKIGDEQVHGKQDWQQGLRLWETQTGRLAGAVLFANEHSAALLCDPERPRIAEAMIAWAENHYVRNGRAAKPLTIEATESNPTLEQLLKSRGYAQPTEHYVRREKSLADSGAETLTLPDGFYVKSIETLAELVSFHKAVEAVFSFRDSVEVYRVLQQAPSYVPDLDLILLSPEGQTASFCTGWLDRKNNMAEFEPVGTVPAFRKRGLGTALLAEASNRLRARGCRTATVYSWSESTAANRLYAGAGLEGMDKLYAWQWQGN
jgi:ribosomal protein S18 acetylase RimI-like enzyme